MTKVKGLGIELEAAVAAPVYQVYSNLTASDAVSDIPGDVKQSIGYIEKLTPTETRRKAVALLQRRPSKLLQSARHLQVPGAHAQLGIP